MEYTSPLQFAKDIEGSITRLLGALDVDALPAVQKALVKNLKRLMVDARLDVRDYEYAESRTEQLSRGVVATKRLVEAEQLLLEASKYDLFSSVDVATISARLQQLISMLT